MKNRLLTAALMAGILFSGSSNAQTTLYGITNNNEAFSISNISTPSAISGPYSISGVSSGQVFIGLASRPSTGGLYALGYDSVTETSQLYLLTNGGTSFTATPIGVATTALSLGLINSAAFNFVSTNDNQIRVIGRNGNNYILNANNGSVSSTGTAGLSFSSGDVHAGASTSIAATAYTNSFYGADATDEVGYDAQNNVLVTMTPGSFSNSFNNASNIVNSIGTTIGLTFNSTAALGMATWYDTTAHTNIVFMTGANLLGGSDLYEYTIGSGGTTPTDLGLIGSGSFNVNGIAFQSVRDSTAAVTGQLMAGLSLNLRNILYFDSNDPRNILKEVMVGGLASGQSLVGIDYSSSGTLYGLGYNSLSGSYQLYTIDSATGHASAVNTTAYSLNLGTDNGSGNYINAGFRFIPTETNRIRVIGNNGTVNAQIDATTGVVVETDTNLIYVTGDENFGVTPNLTSVAYTGYSGDASTQLFGFDANTGSIITFDADDNTSGAGDGSSGYINTNLSLGSTLSLAAHTSAYNNAYINFVYDNTTSSNIGFIAANYLGDSATEQENYSVLYNMSDMLSAYHRTAAGSPSQSGAVGYGIPVKDLTVRRTYNPTSVPVVANTANDLLVYPNPVASYTRIILPDVATDPVYVDIINLNGQVVHSYQFGQGTYQMDIDMSFLPTGLYSVRVIGNNEGYHNLKVIKD